MKRWGQDHSTLDEGPLRTGDSRRECDACISLPVALLILQ